MARPKVGEIFSDGKGRTWVVFDRLPFGQNLCTTNGGALSGEWSDRAIREKQASGLEAGVKRDV